ncbi:MAG: pyrrolysine--tRNA(Pyl) ligase large subunit [Candidatus Aminicenantes bacterium]|jgi:phenylalanyl-tRNA synthetase alpha chain|nr:pyrrolysine--tRNA(Pyl) ligase large subunit [Candidatus Aminicenantes bacterium]
MPSEKCGWTTSQMQRLRELNAAEQVLGQKFSNSEERNRNFFKFEQDLVRQSQQNLQALRTKRRRPRLCELEDALTQTLVKQEFVQVLTPILISKDSIEKMSIEPGHELFKQVFWVEEKKCLRPMLAPNLYFLLGELVKIWDKPVRIFEVGPCFRKDTKGRRHVNEFTMLNLVELGLPEAKRKERLEELVTIIMDASGIKEYSFASHRSEVYGETIDVLSNFEVASGAMGPHPLDSNWGITDPWVGIGFGLERLLMVRENFQNIQRAGRALVYLDGERLNI